ncbi:hypothetical protein CDL12_19867 [Handroanthus impetiginosus]|uniref:Uncharacterized protein n=1 Tax=Handroanthus impetiginosus TaxID=429701 RepID=A0A2G9GQM3_9LAMI|nr:hypothetical protein CDL12_19867 [Handroanthus impetiginosus]
MEYIRRFTEAALEVLTAHKEVLANAFVKRLWDGPFFSNLVKKLVDDFDELLARAEKYINLEEAIKIKRAESNDKRKDKKKEGSVQKKTRMEGQERSPPFMQCMDNFTPLKSNAFCRFHNEYGHDTDEYMHSRNEFERLIQKGMLKEFIAKEDHSNRKTQDRRKEHVQEPINLPRRGTIQMIFGNPTNGDSNRAWRNRTRVGDNKSPIIQFGLEDSTGLDSPYQDALVIMTNITNYDIARVFINCDSSVDILFLKAFKQMDLRPVKMEAVQISLVGFLEESVHLIGQIALPLSLGHGEEVKTRMVRFLIVDALSAYNTILGRLMLNLFQAIPSTYHMKIKYLVGGRVGEVRGDRVGEVRGDRVAAKKCYVEAVRVSNKHRGAQPDGGMESQLKEG